MTHRKLPFGNKKQLIALTVMAAAILVAGVLSVWAAFMGAGYKKGVAVSNEYYFTSNVLNTIGQNGALSIYPYVAAAGESKLDIQIRNYDRLMVSNSVTITYHLEYCLGAAANAGYSFAMSRHLGNDQYSQTYSIASTEWQSFPGSFTLAAGELLTDTFRLTVTCPAEIDYAAVPPVLIKAVPDAPVSMNTYILGAAVTLSEKVQQFSITGTFDSRTTNDLGNMAGFLYNITAQGVAAGAGQTQAEITWNATQLELNSFTGGTATVTEGENGAPDIGRLIVDINSGEYLSLAFYRGDGWDNTNTLSDLRDLVMYCGIAGATP